MTNPIKAIFQIALIAILGFFFSGNVAFADYTIAQNWSYSNPAGGNLGTLTGSGMTFTATTTGEIGEFTFKACMATTTQDVRIKAYSGQLITGTSSIAHLTQVGTSSTVSVSQLCGGDRATTTVQFSPALEINASTTYTMVTDCPNVCSGQTGQNVINIGEYPLYNRATNQTWTVSGSAGSNFIANASGTAPYLQTRIINFTPENGTTTGNEVYFSIDYFVAPEDVGVVQEVEVRLRNIDQNVLLSSFFSDYDFTVYIADIEASGEYNFSDTVYLPNGNYRVEARMRSNVFGFNFGNVLITENHQFIVGSSTFIGNISQNSFTALNAIFGSTTATSTEALAGQCTPFAGWDTIGCLAFLFVPDAGLVYDSLNNTFDLIKTRFPLGYVTRFVVIVTDDNVVALPDFTVSFLTGENATSTLTFSPSEMIDGANDLLTETRDPFYGNNLRDVFEPIVKLVFALLVLMYIVTDLTTKNHEDGQVWSDPSTTEKIKGLRRIK